MGFGSENIKNNSSRGKHCLTYIPSHHKVAGNLISYMEVWQYLPSLIISRLNQSWSMIPPGDGSNRMVPKPVLYVLQNKRRLSLRKPKILLDFGT